MNKTAWITPLKGKRRAKITLTNGEQYPGTKAWYVDMTSAISHAKQICSGSIFINGTWKYEGKTDE